MYYRVSTDLDPNAELYSGLPELHRHRGRVGIVDHVADDTDVFLRLDVPGSWEEPGELGGHVDLWWFYEDDLIIATGEEYHCQQIMDRLEG